MLFFFKHTGGTAFGHSRFVSVLEIHNSFLIDIFTETEIQRNYLLERIQWSLASECVENH